MSILYIHIWICYKKANYIRLESIFEFVQNLCSELFLLVFGAWDKKKICLRNNKCLLAHNT